MADTTNKYRLLAAASPSGKLVAVNQTTTGSTIVTPSSTAPNPTTMLRLAVLQVSSGDLQTTLTYKKQHSFLDTKTTTTAATEATIKGNVCAVTKILFLDEAHVAVLLSRNNGEGRAPGFVVVWDLRRGVMVYTYGENIQVIDVIPVSTPQGHYFSCLVHYEDDEKLQIHQIDVETGKLVKKIKAGKGLRSSSLIELSSVQTTSSNDNTSQTLYCVLQADYHYRALDSITGNKVCKKSTLLDKSRTVTDSMMAPPPLVAWGTNQFYTVIQGNIVTVNATTGTIETQWPLPSAFSDLQSRSGRIMVNGTHVYHRGDKDDQNAPRVTLFKQFHLDPAIEKVALLLQPDAEVIAILLSSQQKYTIQRLHLMEITDVGITVTNQIPADPKSVHGPESSSNSSAANDNKNKKRSIVVGPAQAGTEARQVSDIMASKKPKLDRPDGDGENIDEDEDVTERQPTIAQRLEQLQRSLDEESVRSDTSDDEKVRASYFQPRKATTESLSQLLQQALQARDDSMLELAFSVKDAGIIDATCRSLSDDMLAVLLTALTSRLASKPNRAEYLCKTWLTAVLRTGRVRSISHLQPLRNLVQERLEIFPALLQLQGKLCMLGTL